MSLGFNGGLLEYRPMISVAYRFQVVHVKFVGPHAETVEMETRPQASANPSDSSTPWSGR